MNHHYQAANRRAKYRYLPWFLCQAHWEALPLAERRQYIGCIRRGCDLTAGDCDRCPQNGWTAHPELKTNRRAI